MSAVCSVSELAIGCSLKVTKRACECDRSDPKVHSPNIAESALLEFPPAGKASSNGFEKCAGMTTAIDTNVIIALWQTDDALNLLAESMLERTGARSQLVIAAPVFAELMAAPGRNVDLLEDFFRETGIRIDWDLDERVWRMAGAAFQAFAMRRRRSGQPEPRRILTDFLIGAHALRFGYRLLTFDRKLYSIAFPGLALVTA